ncbi:ArsR/SmtB family transcription factor [Kitasatospora sp. NPDC002543]
MLRIHFTPQDFTRITLAPRPAPLQELNTALATMCRTDADPLHAPWRRRALHALPPSAAPLADLVPAGRAPAFLDVFADGLPEALEQVRTAPPGYVRTELRRAYEPVRGAPPPWVRDLARGDAPARRLVHRAQRAAYETLLAPVWDQVRDLHRAEFARRAVQLAQDGAAALLAALVPGARLREAVWELPGAPGEIRLAGRGLLLLPTFHWYGPALPAEPPGRPVALTYPAGTGLLPRPDGRSGERALAAVLGATRGELLHLLAREHTTSELARRLGVSAATVSAHAGVLRGAGLITTVRAGKAVLHRRTALGDLLVGN